MSSGSSGHRPVKQLRGLQKLRFYCQMCQKQCRDENGFQNHIHSEKHIRQMQLFLENPEEQMEQFSNEFEEGYMSLLRRRGDNPVNANNLYQEMIADKSHVHMTATKWDSLTTFLRYLADTGKAEVTIEDGKYYVKYINRDADFLKRQQIVERQKLAAQESQKFTDEALNAQIDLAHAEAKSKQVPAEVVPDDVDVTTRATRVSFALAKPTVSPSAVTVNTSSTTPDAGTVGDKVASPPSLPPGIAKRPGPPGIAGKLNTPILGKPNALAKPSGVNVFGKPQPSTSGNVFAQAGKPLTPSAVAQAENKSTEETSISLGQKRSNPTHDTHFTWFRQGLVVRKLNENGKFTVLGLIDRRQSPTTSLDASVSAKLRSEVGSKDLVVEAQDEANFATSLPGVGQDVCLIRWGLSDTMSKPTESSRQTDLRKKLSIAMKACQNVVSASDLPKAAIQAVSSATEIVVSFPGGVELTVHSDDICQFVELN